VPGGTDHSLSAVFASGTMTPPFLPRAASWMWAAVPATPVVVTLPWMVQSRSTVNFASPDAFVVTGGTSSLPVRVTFAWLALMVDAHPATRPTRAMAASAVRKVESSAFMAISVLVDGCRPQRAAQSAARWCHARNITARPAPSWGLSISVRPVLVPGRRLQLRGFEGRQVARLDPDNGREVAQDHLAEIGPQRLEVAREQILPWRLRHAGEAGPGGHRRFLLSAGDARRRPMAGHSAGHPTSCRPMPTRRRPDYPESSGNAGAFRGG